MPSLKIDLIVDDKGNVQIANVTKGFEELNAQATKLGRSFEGAFAGMQSTLTSIDASLKKTTDSVSATHRRIQQISKDTTNAIAGQWTTLGIRSKSAIAEEMAAVVTASKNRIALAASDSAEVLRIRSAANAKLVALQKELTNVAVNSNAKHESSMANLTRTVLRWYAAYYVGLTAIHAVSGLIMGGVKAIDDLKINTIAVAAMITSMQGTTGNIVENYKENVKYAGQLNVKLMEIDANSFANYEQIQLMNRAMTTHGVILDTNNAKQAEAFTAITNSIALLTTGQNKEMQAAQEMDALMSGRIKQTDRVALMIDGIIKQEGIYKGGLAEVVKLGQQHGDTLQRLAPYLVGITAATGDISQTWESVKSSLETTWGIIQRGVFKDVYKDLTEGGRTAVAWMKANSEEIVSAVNTVYNTISFAIKTTIGLMATFAAVTVAKMIIAGDAAAWFALQWEIMARRVNIATLSMGVTWKVFIAAIVGFSIGTWLSNEFEIVRKAGIYMVYGIMDAWDWLVEKMKIGWEYAKLGSSEEGDTATQVKVFQENIKRIKQEYAEEKALKARFKAEQLAEATDAYRAQQAAQKKAQKTIAVPKVKPNMGGDDKAADGAKQLADQFKKAIDSVKDNIARLQAETSGLGEFRLELEKNRLEYEKYVRDMDEKLSPAQRAQLIALAEQQLKLKDQVEAIKETARQRKLAVDGVNDETAATLKDKTDTERLKDAYDSLAMSLDPVLGARKEYIRQSNLIKDAQALVTKGLRSQEDLNRTNALREAKRALYNANTVADYYSQISGMEDAALEKKLAAIEAERKANLVLYTEEKDRIAANALAAQKAAKARADAFSAKTEPYMQMLGSMAEALQGISSLYREGSKEAEGFSAAAEALIIVQKTLAVVNAVAAVASSASAPWPVQWANMAAMIGAMGSLLGTIGASISGGGGSSATAAEAYKPTTVLGGESGEASKSIENALNILNDIDADSYIELQGIHNSMRELNDNITGLVRSLIQGDGSLSDIASGITESNKVNTSLMTGISVLGTVMSSAGMVAGALGISGAGWLGGGITGAMAGYAGTGTISGAMAGAGTIPIVGWVLSAIAAIDMLTGGAISSFISSKSSKVSQQGVKIDSATVTDVFEGKLHPQYYVGISTKKKSWGHIKRDYDETMYEMDKQTAKFFELIYTSFSTGLLSIGQALGQDSAKVLSYAFEAQTLNLNGLDASQINDAINDWMNELADTAVDALFGDILLQYQQLGEGIYETAIRVIGQKEIVLDAMDQIGAAFQGGAESAVAFADTLVQMSGDIDDLIGTFSTYISKFVPEEQQHTNLKTRLQSVFTVNNLGALPDTRSGYAALVNSTSGAISQETAKLETAKANYATVLSAITEEHTVAVKRQMALEEAARAATATGSWWDTIRNIQAQYAGLTEAERIAAAIDADDRLATVMAATDAQQAIVDTETSSLYSLLNMADAADEYYSYIEDQWQDAKDKIIDSLSSQIDASNTAADTARNLAETYTGLSESLLKTIADLKAGELSTATIREKTAQAKVAMLAAYANPTTENLGNLPSLATSYLSAAKASSATAFEYRKAFGQTLLTLNNASRIATSRATEQEVLASAIDAQTAKLEAALAKIEASTFESASSLISLDMNGINAILDASSTFDIIANTDGIPDDLKEILYSEAQDYELNLIASLMDDTPDAIKNMLLAQSGEYAATINTMLGIVDDDSRKLALTAAGDYLATVNAVLGVMDASSAILAGGSGVFGVTVNAETGAIGDDVLKLAFENTNSLLTVINAVFASDINAEAQALALNTVNEIETTVTTVALSDEVRNSEAGKLALETTNLIATTVETMLLSDEVRNSEAGKLALNAENAIATTVKTWALADEVRNSDAGRLALNASNDLATTVTVIALDDVTRESAAVRLALNATNELATTVTALLGMAESGAIGKTAKDTLGNPTAEAIFLAFGQATDLTTTILAQLGIMEAAALGKTAASALDGSDIDAAIFLAFQDAHVLKTVITASISKDEETTAALAALSQSYQAQITGSGSPSDPVMGLYQSIFGRNPLQTNDQEGYTYWLQKWAAGLPLTQIAASMFASPEYAAIKAGRSFADGGVSTGPESGYGATLHGTELIVSPKKGYPATVVGADSGEIVTALKAAKEDARIHNQAIIGRLNKIESIAKKWDNTFDDIIDDTGVLTRTA